MQVLASFQFMPLPGVMFGDAADKAFRVSPRWLVLAPEQGVLEPGDSINIKLHLLVVGGPDGCAQTLAIAQVHCTTPCCHCLSRVSLQDIVSVKSYLSLCKDSHLALQSRNHNHDDGGLS